MEEDSDLGILLDNIESAFALATPHGQILHASRALCQRLGYTRAELEGLSVLDLIVEEDNLSDSSTIEQALDNGEATKISKQYRCKDGEAMDAITIIKPIYDVNAKPKAICITLERFNQSQASETQLEAGFKSTFSESELQDLSDAIAEQQALSNITAIDRRAG